jgi:SulP family sulfate permease
MKEGKRFICHLSADCRRPFHDADDVIDINIIEDPTYKVSRLKKRT